MRKIIFLVAASTSGFVIAEKVSRRPAQSYLSIDVSGYYGSPKDGSSELVLKSKEGENLKTYLEHDFSSKKKVSCSLECTSESDCTVKINR